MEIIYILLPLALILSGTFVLFYIWSVNAGQYDDLETPQQKILIDEKEHELNGIKIQ